MRILTTGASGFVGGAVLKTAKSLDLDIRGAYRNNKTIGGDNVAIRVDLNANSNWTAALTGIDVESTVQP